MGIKTVAFVGSRRFEPSRCGPVAGTYCESGACNTPLPKWLHSRLRFPRSRLPVPNQRG